MGTRGSESGGQPGDKEGLELVVCLKHVPMVSELPWDPKTGTLMRDLGEGMMNPACRYALEAALRIREERGGRITVLTMGPPMAEEVLMEAMAMGADRGVLITDPAFAGADTLATSYTLARTIEKICRDFDLILCGTSTSDSETAQVGPQIAEELDIPIVAYVSHFAWWGGALRLKRLSDHFIETLEMDLPGLITVTTNAFKPRYVPIGGLTVAFNAADIQVVDFESLGADKNKVGHKGSPTKILKVYSASAKKGNIVLTGTPRKIVEDFFANFEDFIGGAAAKDLKASW